MDPSYLELLKLNSEFVFSSNSKPYRLRVLSNVIVNPLIEILEYYLRERGVYAVVEVGNYDNIAQDALMHCDQDLTVVFWETVNLIDGLQFKVEQMNSAEIDSLFSSVVAQIDLTFTALEGKGTVILNLYSSLAFDGVRLDSTLLSMLSERLNSYIKERVPSNFILINTDKILATVGVENAIDRRFFYSSKALYTTDLLQAYAVYIKPIIFSLLGMAKKALILDCDNTLWSGVLGEDGFHGIEMAADTSKGKIFHEVQSLIVEMANKGVIVGLCSKNNTADVQQVLSSHPDMVLKDDAISVMRINWQDKVTNLKEIAKELNVGIDSIVFVDDSSFETNMVKDRLPEVITCQVPTRLYDYPAFMRNVSMLFYQVSHTGEDLSKVKQYKEQHVRKKEQARFDDVDEYLASLELELTEWVDDIEQVPRISQLTQKTNQFILTTVRHTEAEISSWINSSNHLVISYGLHDKFGDYGITAVCILDLSEQNTARIETLLLSCRIIGRNVERVIIDRIIEHCRAGSIHRIMASYRPTNKNSIVAELWNQVGFKEVSNEIVGKEYVLPLSEFVSANIEYIQLNTKINENTL